MLLFTLAQAFKLFPAQIWERQRQGLNLPSDSDQGFVFLSEAKVSSLWSGRIWNYQAATDKADL